MNPIDYFNATNIADISKEQFVDVASSVVAVPSLIILFIGMSLMFLVVGLTAVKESKVKMIVIWFFSVLLSSVILLAVIYLPQSIFNIAEFFRNIWG
jgi:uncharacterized membrane protein YozB (DUF420 family)